jgi:hypothetical protein
MTTGTTSASAPADADATALAISATSTGDDLGTPTPAPTTQDDAGTSPTAEPPPTGASTATPPAAEPGPPAQPSAPPAGRNTVGGCTVFPADNYWHADVSKLPVDPHSAAWLSNMSPARKLHPDFGPSGGAVDYGMPITIVDGSHPKVSVDFYYPDESDHVLYPLGSDTKIEGGADSGGDMHAIIVDSSSCQLYETFATTEVNGQWQAGSGATWNLNSNALRPAGWTSADAAGLPILPGLLRWSEVQNNTIDHAIRFTTNVTSKYYLWPAMHQAGSTSSLDFPPMGARFRLDPAYTAAGLSGYAQESVRAMQTYGLVLADNGSPWFFQGDADPGWPPSLIDELKTIPASAFVAVDTSSLQR